MRLAVTQTDYGYDFNDIVWAYTPSTIPVYEGDVIQIWGHGDGAYSYESQAGWQITVPSVSVMYWAKVQ